MDFLRIHLSLQVEPERRKIVEHTWATLGIHIRAIQPKHTTTRELIERYAPRVVKYITGNILFTTARRTGQSIIIENEDIANAERELFELAWEKGVLFE